MKIAGGARAVEIILAIVARTGADADSTEIGVGIKVTNEGEKITQ